MSEIPSDWIVSKAHDWVQSLPLSSGRVTCARCGISTLIINMDSKNVPCESFAESNRRRFIERCVPHYESKDSGWIDE